MTTKASLSFLGAFFLLTGAVGCSAPPEESEARGSHTSAIEAPKVAVVEIVVDGHGVHLEARDGSGLRPGQEFAFHLARGVGFDGDRRPFQLSGPWTAPASGDDGFFVLGGAFEETANFRLNASVSAPAMVHIFAQMELGLQHAEIDSDVALPLAKIEKGDETNDAEETEEADASESSGKPVAP